MVRLTSGCVSLRVEIVDDLKLARGMMGRFDLNTGKLEIAASATATARPRIAAEAVMRGWLDKAPFTVDKTTLAEYLAPMVAMFAQEVESSGGMYAFMKCGGATGKSRYRGMINGSEQSGRDCGCCGDACASGSVAWRPVMYEDREVAEIVCDCEWCGPTCYLESLNAAGRPSMSVIQEVAPRKLTEEERENFYLQRKGVIGSIYVK